MGWDEDIDKLNQDARLIDQAYKFGTLGVPNVRLMTQDYQREGENPSDGFSGFLDEGEGFRDSYSAFIQEFGTSALTQWLEGIAVDTILSNSSDLESIIVDLKQWMIDNSKTIKTRAITKGTWTPGSSMGNKATLYTENNDWLGEDIETGKGGYNWEMKCKTDKHMDASYDFSGLMDCKSNVPISNYFIGTGVVVNYNFVAVSGETSGNLIANNASFDDFSPTAAVKYTGWYSPDWTDISQSTTVYFHYRIGTRDNINIDGVGESCTFVADAEMYYYLNDVGYSKYVPYGYWKRYKYSTDCDGTITLHLGTQNTTSPVDGEPAAYTGTVEFIFGADPLKVRGTATFFIKELKVGDIIWNSLNDTIADAQAIASIDDDLNITLAANYTGTAGDTKTLGGKNSGWHDLYIINYLDNFEEDSIRLGFALAGNTTGTLYFDDQIHRELDFYPEHARFEMLVSGQTDLVEGDEITFSDSIPNDSITQRYFALHIESTLIPLSLPHDASPTEVDPNVTAGTVEFQNPAANRVTGTGTRFLTEVAPGDFVWDKTADDPEDGLLVLTVDSDVLLTLSGAYGGAAVAGHILGIFRDF